MILSDANDLYSLLPFKNNEILDVAFSSPQNDSVKLKLRMYGREEKSIKDSGRTSQYKLKFVSPETFLNSGIKFSRSYTGKISSMVGALWTENFKDVRGPESSNKIKVEETSDEYSLVLPFENASHIHNFTKKAKSGSSSESCSYFFYEDFKGFNFVSLESIFQQNPRAYFSYELRESALEKEKPIGTDTLGSRYRIRDLTFSCKENILDEIKNGLYSGVINIHDVMNKKISSSVFKYDEHFGEVSHLNEHPLTTTEISSGVGPFATYKSKFLGGYDPEISTKRRSQIIALNDRKIKFKAAGNSSLNVGEVVKIDFMSQVDTPETRLHKYRSGNYLVTSVIHTISKLDGYTMTIEAWCDSFSQQIPSVSKFGN